MSSLFPAILRAAPRSSAAAITTRAYHATPAFQAYKNSQDRNTLKPGSTEYTKSGRDDDGSKLDAAFDPNNTSPEGEKNSASSDPASNPLEASGANQGLSKPQGDEKEVPKRGVGKETSKGGRSHGESSQKNRDPRDF
ncbi:hypothetical protein HJFPF1_08968 [Paramyrothecium foliicola]|nr:hypothetical protein HJFPF1_08968 [Paramyrothecium foliicola]